MSWLHRCAQNGPPSRREEEAYPAGSVTDEQRRRRAIFSATRRAAVLWAVGCVARLAEIATDIGYASPPRTARAWPTAQSPSGGVSSSPVTLHCFSISS